MADYTIEPMAFRIKKALRYVRLYGVQRTAIKIRAQYHMKRRYKTLPPEQPDRSKKAHVGMIGCGSFAYSNLAYYLTKNYGSIIRASMDVDIHRAASLFERYGLQYFTDDATRILEDDSIDTIFIASNHASHAEYAIDALKAGKHVHIEKPHVVTSDQLVRLCRAIKELPQKASLGFNRPQSRLGVAIKTALDAQKGPAVMNWFIAGHEISPDHWYFQEEEGGRVLGNLCHWTDFVFQLVPEEHRHPITITPTRSAKSDCDIAVTYTFGDGSIAAITFSAMGHTFEGVRERFAAQRGNVLISLDDFKRLAIEVVDKKRVTSLWFRDHGHEDRVKASYQMSEAGGNTSPGASCRYAWETGELFLKTKEALETDSVLVIGPYDDSKISPAD